jgi:hypothetical protein
VSALPPADPKLNRQLIAERLGWPEGALAECDALEEAFPRWSVFWTRGGLPWTPNPGYRGSLRMHNNRWELFAATADELRAKLVEADAQLPRA